MEGGPMTWSLMTHVGILEGVPACWLRPDSAQVVKVTWGNQPADGRRFSQLSRHYCRYWEYNCSHRANIKVRFHGTWYIIEISLWKALWTNLWYNLLCIGSKWFTLTCTLNQILPFNSFLKMYYLKRMIRWGERYTEIFHLMIQSP